MGSFHSVAIDHANTVRPAANQPPPPPPRARSSRGARRRRRGCRVTLREPAWPRKAPHQPRTAPRRRAAALDRFGCGSVHAGALRWAGRRPEGVGRRRMGVWATGAGRWAMALQVTAAECWLQIGHASFKLRKCGSALGTSAKRCARRTGRAAGRGWQSAGDPLRSLRRFWRERPPEPSAHGDSNPSRQV